MANLLYLVHRLPYRPNKCDRVRSSCSIAAMRQAAAQRMFQKAMGLGFPCSSNSARRTRDYAAESRCLGNEYCTPIEKGAFVVVRTGL